MRLWESGKGWTEEMGEEVWGGEEKEGRVAWRQGPSERRQAMWSRMLLRGTGSMHPLDGPPNRPERATVQESWRSFCLKHYLGTFRSEMSTVAGRVKGQINGWDGEYSRNERILKKGKEGGQTGGREEGRKG